MKNIKKIADTGLLRNIRKIIQEARSTVARSVDFVQVWTNFHIGRMIVEHEQKGEVRAEYSERLLKSLSSRLTAEFARLKAIHAAPLPVSQVRQRLSRYQPSTIRALFTWSTRNFRQFNRQCLLFCRIKRNPGMTRPGLANTGESGTK